MLHQQLEGYIKKLLRFLDGWLQSKSNPKARPQDVDINLSLFNVNAGLHSQYRESIGFLMFLYQWTRTKFNKPCLWQIGTAELPSTDTRKLLSPWQGGQRVYAPATIIIPWGSVCRARWHMAGADKICARQKNCRLGIGRENLKSNRENHLLWCYEYHILEFLWDT